LIIPITVTTAERSFWKLKLIKSYLRRTILQEKLDELTILPIDKDLLVKLDFKNLIRNIIVSLKTQFTLNILRIYEH
jgi:hypothetical protein